MGNRGPTTIDSMVDSPARRGGSTFARLVGRRWLPTLCPFILAATGPGRAQRLDVQQYLTSNTGLRAPVSLDVGAEGSVACFRRSAETGDVEFASILWPGVGPLRGVEKVPHLAAAS